MMGIGTFGTENDLAYIVSELDSLFALSITPADLHGFAGFLCTDPCRGKGC